MSGKNITQVRSGDADGIAVAARLLREGGLVALPTETVYGLAARADSEAAVARIYAAKGRPAFNPLIVHVADLAAAQGVAVFEPLALRLAHAFWPGPLTLVLPARAEAGLAPAVTAGLPTVALRVPAHPVMRGVLDASRLPLAAPSANRSGAVSPTRADHVVASLGKAVDLVLDGGECRRGLESTIVAVRDASTLAVLRPGPVTEAMLAAELRGATLLRGQAGATIEAPGQLARHYAPGKPVRLEAEERAPGEFLIGFGPVRGDISLSVSGNLEEAARRLYACLHEAAASPCPRIAVAPVPPEGLGAAINDRLRRAAVPDEA